jgi:hypothetical protein
MDNTNLRDEQRDALDQAIDLIDDALMHIDSNVFSRIVKDLHDARKKVNMVARSEREASGPAFWLSSGERSKSTLEDTLDRIWKDTEKEAPTA